MISPLLKSVLNARFNERNKKDKINLFSLCNEYHKNSVSNEVIENIRIGLLKQMERYNKKHINEPSKIIDIDAL